MPNSAAHLHQHQKKTTKNTQKKKSDDAEKHPDPKKKKKETGSRRSPRLMTPNQLNEPPAAPVLPMAQPLPEEPEPDELVEEAKLAEHFVNTLVDQDHHQIVEIMVRPPAGRCTRRSFSIAEPSFLSAPMETRLNAYAGMMSAQAELQLAELSDDEKVRKTCSGLEKKFQYHLEELRNVQ